MSAVKINKLVSASDGSRISEFVGLSGCSYLSRVLPKVASDIPVILKGRSECSALGVVLKGGAFLIKKGAMPKPTVDLSVKHVSKDMYNLCRSLRKKLDKSGVLMEDVIVSSPIKAAIMVTGRVDMLFGIFWYVDNVHLLSYLQKLFPDEKRVVI